MDTTLVSHAVINQYHKNISIWNNALKGFHRADFSEFQNQLRDGVWTPCIILEAADMDLKPTENQVATFNHRTISFMILDYAPWDDYDMREQVLDEMERITHQVVAKLNADRKDTSHWLFGKFDGDVAIQKVGPVFDSMYGWNVVYTLKNKQKMCINNDDWNFTIDSE